MVSIENVAAQKKGAKPAAAKGKNATTTAKGKGKGKAPVKTTVKKARTTVKPSRTCFIRFTKISLSFK